MICGAQRLATGSLGILTIAFNPWGPWERFFEFHHPVFTSLFLGVILMLRPRRIAHWASIGRSRLLGGPSSYFAAALAWTGIVQASHHALHLPHLYYSKDPLQDLAGTIAGFLIGTLLFFAAVPLARLWECCAGIARSAPTVHPPSG
jgi:hypothetical protein